MKTIEIYKTRKKLFFILLIILVILLVLYLITEGWSDPNWLLLFSLTCNLFAVLWIYITNYKNTKIKLFKDKIIYRLAGQKKEELIPVFEETVFSKDWKGVYIKKDNDSNMISLNGINFKEGERIFKELKDFYQIK